MGPITSDPDGQIANLVEIARRELEAKRQGDATETEITEATSHLWALRNLQAARGALRAIEKSEHPHVVRQLAREGLTLIEEETP